MRELSPLEKEIVRLLLEKKAREIVVLDVEERIVWTRSFVICSGLVDLHLVEIARHLMENLKKAGFLRGLPVHTEESRSWILLDLGSTVVHIFLPEAREYYGLEKQWGDEGRMFRVRESFEGVPPEEPAV